MTKKQIEILLKAEEIILSGRYPKKHPNPEVEMIKFQGYPIFYNDEKGYELNDNLIKSLNQIFELYSSFESLKIACLWLQKFELLMQQTSKEQKIILLKNNVQKELNRKQYFQEKLPAWVFQFLQPGWIYLQRSNLEKIIEVLKFKILKGQAIINFDRKKCSGNYSLKYCDEFFKKSNELNPIYQILACDKKLEFLQNKLTLIKEGHSEERRIKIIDITIPQIALIHFYNAKQITRENCNKIVTTYGFKSGEKLFQKFTFYSKTSNRTDKPTPFTKRKMQNKIDLFESVIPQLTLKAKQRADDELVILKNEYKTEFG